MFAYLTFPAAAPDQAAQQQHFGTPEPGGETPRRRSRHLRFAGLRLPNEASIVRRSGAVLMEANDEWLLQHRYLSLEPLAGLASATDEEPVTCPPCGPTLETGVRLMETDDEEEPVQRGPDHRRIA